MGRAASLLLLPLILVTLCVTVRAADIYDHLAALCDSLNAWTLHPPMPDTSGDERTLAELFPGSELRSLPDSGDILIHSPPLQGLPDEYLRVSRKDWEREKSIAKAFSVDVRADENTFYLDDRGFRCENLGRAALNRIARRLVVLRTLGLPQKDRPTNTVFSTDRVELRVRGRETSTFEFTRNDLDLILSKFAAGQHVRSGISSLKCEQDKIEIGYYVMLTLDSGRAQHYFHWRETLDSHRSTIKTVMSVVEFIPFIRTDNLKEIFATSEMHESTVPVKIGRPLTPRK